MRLFRLLAIWAVVASWALTANPMSIPAQQSTPSRSDAPSETRPSPLVLRMETQDTVELGQPLTVRLILANESDTTLSLVYGGSGRPDFGLEVRTKPVGAPLWYSASWSSHDSITDTGRPNQAYFQQATEGELPARGVRVLTVIWPQATLAATSVPPGTYYLWGWAHARLPRSRPRVLYEITTGITAVTVLAR